MLRYFSDTRVFVLITIVLYYIVLLLYDSFLEIHTVQVEKE